MPHVTLCGIVSRYVNYRESDRIISLLTAELGRVDAKARGCQRVTSPLLPAAQPFVYGRYELFYSRDKYTVNQCELLETFFPLREDYARYEAASIALQLSHYAMQENQTNEALFSLLYHALTFWSYGESNSYDLLCCFFIRYLNVCGFRPAITHCMQCGRDIRGDSRVLFSLFGGAVCADCGGGREISKTALEALRRMLLLSDNEIDRVRLSARLRRELALCLSDYLRHTMDHASRALNSLNIATISDAQM